MLEDLRALVSHASVAGNDAVLDATANHIADLLRAAGFQVSVHPTEGAPIVVAHCAGTSPRHVLFYDHYDVAPAGSRREWRHDPFTVAERDDRLYGRGVAADKANLVARIAAVKALMDANGQLPLNVSFLIEGDALLGSPHLANIVADQADHLQADLVLGYDGQIDAQDRPILYAGVRGRLVVALKSAGAAVPLPAEQASSVANPAWRLIWALSQIKNDSEEVLIEGFYDTVMPPGREANALVRKLDIDEAGRKEAWGIKDFLFGMSGATLARAEAFSPSCNLSLLQAGHGAVPVLPTAAEALVDFTLVPEQRPNEIARLLRAHLDERGFADVQMRVINGAYPPAVTSLASPALSLLADHISAIWGSEPQVSSLAPFTQPLHLFTAGMNIPALPLGLVHPRAVLRGPNEWISRTSLPAMAQLVQAVLGSFAGYDHSLRLVG